MFVTYYLLPILLISSLSNYDLYNIKISKSILLLILCLQRNKNKEYIIV